MARRSSDHDVEDEDPLFQDDTWVAVLDPVELADGSSLPTDVGVTDGRDPVLEGAHSDHRDAMESGRLDDRAERDRPSSYRIRLDVGTGVMVLVRELGGARHGRGWTATIEDVDAVVPRSTFRSSP